MWLKEFKRYFSKIEHFASGEINERGFNNPHPRQKKKYKSWRDKDTKICMLSVTMIFLQLFIMRGLQFYALLTTGDKYFVL